MFDKILFVAVGAAAGYLIGTRRGRRDLDMLKRKASEVWLDPRVQKVAAKAGDLAEQNLPDGVADRVSDVVDSVTTAARRTTRAGRPDRTPGPPASAAG